MNNKPIIEIKDNEVLKSARSYNFTNEYQWQHMVNTYRSYTLLGTDHKLSDRIMKMKDYLISCKIKSVIVGVSGGIDSAVVLGMLENYVQSGISVHAVNITFDSFSNSMNLESNYVDLLKERFPNVIWHNLDMSRTMIEMQNDLKLSNLSLQKENDIMYALRYQAFFALAKSVGGVTIGTTNLDECGYVGWFGKNSDMMVDIQPIMNLHKFEVRRWAELLDLPQEIIKRAPTGDLPNKKTDEEVFGVDYDSLSLYTAMHVSCDIHGFMGNEFVLNKFEKVRQIRKENNHKYYGQQYNPIRIL